MRKSTILKIGIIGIVVALCLVAGFLLLNRWENQTGRFPEQETAGAVVKYEGREYVLKDHLETFLVLGLDKFDGTSGMDSYNNDKQADFLMLFVFDHDAKQYTAIQINRDTMVDVNVLGVAGNRVDTVRQQIALAHTYGNGKDVSCRNTADSVSSLLFGMKVNHYISVTMDSVVVMNDLVGGVEVEILDDFSGIDDTLIRGETVTLTGEQALTYVRSRQGLEDSTNSARMQRQKQYVRALYEAFCQRAAEDEEFLINAMPSLSDYIISDRSVTQLQTLAEKSEEYEFTEIRDIGGESLLGSEWMEFHADEASLWKTVIEVFYH